MRAFLAGLFLLAMCGSAAGQATGFVEQIGFGKRYRPYGWTPIRVNLTSQLGEAAKYQIQVRQEDLDRDRVIFRRDIVLNARTDRNEGERFWVYFIAQPRGLADGSPAELNKLLDVRLCTESGKPLFKLGIQDRIENIDPIRQGYGAQRGTQVVLFVIDGSSRSTPATSEYGDATGLSEDVERVMVTPYDLPENVIGYDAVDAVVWLDADASTLTSGGSRRLTALTEFVREGGRLVVCQPAERSKVEPLAGADLLPVKAYDGAGDWIIPLRDRKDLGPIRRLSSYRLTDSIPGAGDIKLNQHLGWNEVEKKGPFKVAFAQLRDDAVGEEWIDWTGKGTEVSPWIARRALGFGSVTWVAQDLGNPTITGVKSSGWPYVWDKVLGQQNTDMRAGKEYERGTPAFDAAAAEYSTSNNIDLGGSLLRGMEHEGRAGGLVFLAGVFFVGYWVVAGPVSYLVLAGKKRTDMSWTVFAVSALVATLLTVGVVRLVLRGDPEVHHVSLVRMLPPVKDAEGNPISRAYVNSRIGLYIPRDDKQRVKLLDNDPQAVSYLTPFSPHPAHHASTTDFPAYLEYEIPVRDNPLTEPVLVSVPYRSTLKKLQARWAGHLKGGIEVAGGTGNNLRLIGYTTNAQGAKVQAQTGTIGGRLINRAGTDLAHVYFVYNCPPTYAGGNDFDFVLYAPSWKAGDPVDLEPQFGGAAGLQLPGTQGGSAWAQPGGSNKRWIRGSIEQFWGTFWLSGLRPTGIGDQFDDSRNEFLRSFPMLSLFQRIAPQANKRESSDRVEVLRRAAREWDASELVAAGQLLILAQGGQPGVTSDLSPLPFPMEVEGDVVTGSGTTFYQFTLPLDRSELPKPWSKVDDDQPAKPAKPRAAG